MTSIDVMLLLETQSDFSGSTEKIFRKLFFSAEENYDNVDYPYKRNFFGIDELRTFIAESVDVIIIQPNNKLELLHHKRLVS
jgi:hypothetical protein